MLPIFIGKARSQVLSALRRDWLEGKRAVALLEGFSGTGKSVLAGELSEASKIPTARVDAFADDENLQNLFLDLAIALEALGIDSLSKEVDKGEKANFASALREVIRHNRVLVIIDEVQHTFLQDVARPPVKLTAAVKQLGSFDATGKLLLISSRITEHDVWSENCLRLRLPPLEESEAVELLSRLLEHQKRSDKVNPDRKTDLVRCLGCNPRAIHTLVTCLEFETVDNLISSVPGMWELRDVEVSPELVLHLEKELLARILPKLEDDKNTAKFLRWLSVHRQPFRKEALDGFQAAGFSSAELLRSLVDRMLVEFHHGWHTLNAIAREIGVQQLKKAGNEWLRAHSLAANYHARHFRAKQILHVERLGSSFAELRYHLFQAGRLGELQELSERFTTFIRKTFDPNQIPTDPAVLDERIALLTILLGKEGAKGLEYHLTRCLLKRNAPGDQEAALEHIRRATGPQSPSHAWLLRIDLERKLVGLAASRSAWKDAISHVIASGDAVPIFQRAAQILARDGQLNEAIELLGQGINKIPPENSQSDLCLLSAELMVRNAGADAEKVDLAIDFLQECIEKIPPEFGLMPLYQLCGELIARNGNLTEAIILLEEGIKRIPVEQSRNRVVDTALRLAYQAGRKDLIQDLIAYLTKLGGEQFSLNRCFGECLCLALDEDWSGVLNATQDGLRVSSYVPLMSIRAEAHIWLGNLEAAWIVLASYEKPTSVHGGLRPALWLKAWIALKTGRQDDTNRFAAQYADSRAEFQTPVTESGLLELWSAVAIDRPTPITTFFRSLRRWLQPQPSDVPTSTTETFVSVQQSEPGSRCFLVVTTEWDSKNGGLSTFNRLFCRALADARQKVVCYVPVATRDEINRAATDRVRLVSAEPESGVSPMATLLVPPEEIKNLNPDFIVGHDRQSGGYARALQKRDFQKSKRIHFIHTAPEEIESSKPSRASTAAKRGEERVKEQKNQAKDCVLIAGVGPRLAKEFATHVHGGGFAPVHEFTPGFDTDGKLSDASGTVSVPPAIACLLLGRADDYELKGLDLAVKSMGNVVEKWKTLDLPKLVVRGAPEGKGDELSKKMRSEINASCSLQIVVREYSEDLEAIQNDLSGASLLLMPSCVEGFGLVAMEAICKGVPILVSKQSGIAQILPESEKDNILPVRPDALTPLAAEFIGKWTEAIARILNDRNSAFVAAKKLKIEMAKKYTWEAAIHTFLAALGIPINQKHEQLVNSSGFSLRLTKMPKAKF